MFLPHPRVKVSIMGSLRDREVACSASDRQGSNFASCVWKAMSSQSSHHPQEFLLAQFSLYMHKGGLKPDSFLSRVCVFIEWKNRHIRNCNWEHDTYINCVSTEGQQFHRWPTVETPFNYTLDSLSLDGASNAILMSPCHIRRVFFTHFYQ